VNARPDPRAALGSLVFLVLAPGVVAGLIPWWLTRWEVETPFSLWAPFRLVGAVLIVAGILALLDSFRRFVVEGLGTPAPVAPTEELVVSGLYRYVRNPMYVAVAATIFGQALLLGQVELFVYGAVFVAVVAAFVHWYEEPTLARTYGEEYEEYRRAVPGWIPRTSAWASPSSRPGRPEPPPERADPPADAGL
jgi:protein-S-isoprenylcysteine O-methyltransferase Ste14